MIIGLSVEAQTLTSAEIKNQIASQLETVYKKNLDANTDIEVKITATPFAQLQLPDGKVTYKITQGADKIVPHDIKRVDIYVNNAFVKTLNLPTQTSVYKEVLVAADFINREQAITREATLVKRIDVSQKLDYVLSEKVLNKDELYYIYCEFGHKSRKCCEILEKLGYRVVNIVDGYYAYELI